LHDYHLGSTSVTYRLNDGQTIRQLYRPWGEVRYSSSSLPTRYQYTGQYTHAADFGLYFYNARWYDSQLGRFNSADTLVPNAGDPQAWDRYAAMNNNPVNFVDPSGRKPCIDNDKNGQCKVDLNAMHLPPLPDYKPGNENGSWKLITRNGNGVVSWYEYPIINDKNIRDPNDLGNQSYFRMQGSVQLNGINYNWVSSRWVQNHLPCEYASSTQCVTPYEVSTPIQPATGAVHIPGQIPQGQSVLIYIQVIGATDKFGNGILINARDECPACNSTGVDILTRDAYSKNSYNLNDNDSIVYIWIWVPNPIKP
jgi:RHS repeat-associated protein